MDTLEYIQTYLMETIDIAQQISEEEIAKGIEAFLSTANFNASTILGEAFLPPPPTENTKMPSFSFSLEVLSLSGAQLKSVKFGSWRLT